jgi:hypothetical protein
MKSVVVVVGILAAALRAAGQPPCPHDASADADGCQEMCTHFGDESDCKAQCTANEHCSVFTYTPNRLIVVSSGDPADDRLGKEFCAVTNCASKWDHTGNNGVDCTHVRAPPKTFSFSCHSPAPALPTVCTISPNIDNLMYDWNVGDEYIEVLGFVDVNACAEECSNTDKCVSFEFDTPDGPRRYETTGDERQTWCYLYFKQLPLIPTTARRVSLMQRGDCRHWTTEAPTPAPTPPPTPPPTDSDSDGSRVPTSSMLLGLAASLTATAVTIAVD